MASRVNIAWKGDTGQTFSLEIDATTSEQHEAANTVTDHPVEQGASISDHVRQNPNALTISGVISNTPVYLPKDHAGGARDATQKVTAQWDGYDSRGTAKGAPKTLGDALPVPPLLGAISIGLGDEAKIGQLVSGGSLTATVSTFSVPFNRVKDCDEALLDVRNKGLLCVVTTRLRTYERMAIESYSAPVAADTGDALVFTIAFKQVGSGTTETVPVPALPTKKKSKGAISKVESSEPESTSLLRKIVNGH